MALTTKYVRAFDLGGSGLKTCIFGTVPDDKSLVPVQVSKVQNIGTCPAQKSLATWLLECINTLQTEIDREWYFTFSLAGLDKLWSSGKVEAQVLSSCTDKDKIAKLFGLPANKVYACGDGNCHLLASIIVNNNKNLCTHNFSVGTNVGFGVTNQGGKIMTLENLKRRLGVYPWAIPCGDSSSSYDIASLALGKNGLEELCGTDQNQADIDKYYSRWANFIKCEWLPLFRKAGLAEPTAICFTGGIVESSVFHFLLDNDHGWLKDVGLLWVEIGPINAGLLGAALLVTDRGQELF